MNADAGRTRPPLDPAFRRALGIFAYEELAEHATSGDKDRIEGLVPARSIGLRIGDSNLGKTPLTMQEGICVAAGRPYLGRAVIRGRVLYCDAESGEYQISRTIRAISASIGLESPPPDFFLWSPNFDPRPPEQNQTLADVLCEQVRAVQPDHVIVDPLRSFFPDAEEKSREAVAMIRRLRLVAKEIGCSWTLNHHRRKRDYKRTVSLATNQHEWFEEAAGSLALINGTDVRIGVERCQQTFGDLTIAGFARSLGWLEPIALERVLDDDGEPCAYRVLRGLGLLNSKYREAFGRLAVKFRFKDAHAALGGTSGSNTNELLKQCIAAGVLKKEGIEYMKVECVE